MAPYAQDEALMIYLFQESLTGPASKWFADLDRSVTQNWKSLVEAFLDHYAFNEYLALTKEDLGKMEKRSAETIRQYAQRWRAAAAQVQPALSENDMTEEFRKTLKPEYRTPLAVCVGYRFNQLVHAAEKIETEHKLNKANDTPPNRRNENSRKRDESVNVLSVPSPGQSSNYRARNASFNPRAPSNPARPHPSPPGQYQNSPPVHYQVPFSPQYQVPLQAPYQPAYPSQAPVNYRPPAPAGYHQVPPPNAYQNNPGLPRSYRVFDPLPVSYADILRQLMEQNKIAPIRANPNPRTDHRSYNPNAKCVFHSGQIGHDVEGCFPLKNRIQDMIDAKQLVFENQPPGPNIARNPLPQHAP